MLGGRPRHPRLAPSQAARVGEGGMWVSWVVARRLVLGLMLVALAFAGLELMLFLLSALSLD